MTRWPDEIDYSRYMQNPASRLVHPALAGAECVSDPIDGLPQQNGSGQFAVVFRLQDRSGNEFGLKCFLHPKDDRDRRYSTIQSSVTKMAQVDELVPFSYLPKAIRVKGNQTVPAVKMQWVNGTQLDSYIEEHLKDPRIIASLATQLRRAVVNLRRQGAAHADLQHGNILVMRNGRIRLVDFDGMFVPALAGATRFEAGHPNYRHPDAVLTRFDATLDDFPAWLIFLSLRALVREPSLWQLRSGTDQLLLSAEELASPQECEVLLRMTKSSDLELRRIGLTLGAFLSMPAPDIPSFRDETYVDASFPPRWQPQAVPTWAADPDRPSAVAPLPTVPPAKPRRSKRRRTSSAPSYAAPTARNSTSQPAPEWAQESRASSQPSAILPTVPPATGDDWSTRSSVAQPNSSGGRRHSANASPDTSVTDKPAVRETSSSVLIAIVALVAVCVPLLLSLAHVI
jgi:serine/threonine protein kinase